MTGSTNMSSTGGFNPKVIAAVIAMALMAFGALMTLLAWGPDIQSKDRAGAHAYSSSALGYAGLINLLELQGRDVTISRSRRTLSQYESLLILVPGVTSNWLEEALPLNGPTLIILPKWTGIPDRTKPSWQRDTNLAYTRRAENIARYFDENASITRIAQPNIINAPFGRFRPSFDEKLQILQSEVLETIISAPTGALLAKLPESDVYILSDPDLANTFGLATSDNARLMLSIVHNVGHASQQSIIFDATLNGFEQSNSLLRIMLDIPFLGATLVVVIGMLLLGWAACVRFGAPMRETAAFALGKQALADNTAGLFTMTNRETRMAPGYLALSRKAIRKALGTPPTLNEAELTALLERLGPTQDSELTWTQIADGLKSPSSNREDLLNKAQLMYRWRKEKTHGHS